jgi:hypothetical protein
MWFVGTTLLSPGKAQVNSQLLQLHLGRQVITDSDFVVIWLGIQRSKWQLVPIRWRRFPTFM